MRRAGRERNTYAFPPSLFGFDISKWQGVVDFARMKSYGAKFLILRSSYGIKKDEMLDAYVPPAVEQFGGFGIYHFYDPLFSPYEQANILLSAIQPYRAHIRRVWLDLEFWWDGTYSAPQHWRTLRDLVRAAGYKTGWYTRATWWDSRVGTFASEFAADPCWAAQYNVSLTLIPKGWTKAMIWQSGTPSIGSEAGVSTKEIDYNLWNDEFDFAAEWGNAPVPPPQGGDMQLWKTITGLNLRNAPSTSGQILTTMPTGTLVWGDMDASGWIIVKYIQVPGAQYAEAKTNAYCSSNPSYITTQSYVNPPLPQILERELTITVEETGWQPAIVKVIQKKA